MRKAILSLSAFAVMVPASFVGTATPANAHHRHHYYGTTYRHYRTCRHSSGTTGLVAGGVGGALVGHSVLGHGILGTAAGAVGGAVAGRAIDRTVTARRRCR